MMESRGALTRADVVLCSTSCEDSVIVPMFVKLRNGNFEQLVLMITCRCGVRWCQNRERPRWTRGLVRWSGAWFRTMSKKGRLMRRLEKGIAGMKDWW